MTRMKILSAAEQAAFDAPPLFNHRERKQFLEFPTALLAMATSFRQPVNQVCFLVSCGYFRATRQFFPPVDYHPRDVAYVASQLAVDGILLEGYTDRTRQRHQKLILEFYGFQPFDSQSEALLKVEISAMVRETVADFGTLATLYRQLEGILTVLELGHAGIRYYAGSVIRSRMFQLQQRSEADRFIHAAAFVAHQFFRIQDNLVDVLLQVMASFQAEATREHKDHLFDQRKRQSQQIKAAVKELDSSVFGLLREIRGLAGESRA